MSKQIKKERRRPMVVALKDRLNRMSDDELADFSDQCGTSANNLRQIAYGWGGCSVAKAILIIDACEGDIEIGDLIPELKQQTEHA